MQIYNSADGLRSSLTSDKLDGKKIALVPTMGNLHDGHLALIEKAKEKFIEIQEAYEELEKIHKK